MDQEYMTLQEAAEALDMSRATLWRRVKEEEVPTFQSAQDRRVRLLRREDVDALKRPRPIRHTPSDLEGKRAA